MFCSGGGCGVRDDAIPTDQFQTTGEVMKNKSPGYCRRRANRSIRFPVKRAFYLIVTISIFSLLSCSPISQTTVVSKASRGVLDLSAIPFDSSTTVYLNGEWAFYPGEWIAPGKFPSEAPRFVPVPGVWGDLADLEPITHATYRLTFRLPDSVQEFSLHIPEINHAYKLWINGKVAAECGSFGRNGEIQYQKFARSTFYRFSKESDARKVVIVLQVAAMESRTGGILREIMIGSPAKITDHMELTLIFGAFLFGSLLIIGLYHINFFIYYREDHSSLYFGLLAVIMAFWATLSDEDTFFRFFVPDLPYDLLHRILTMGLGVILALAVRFTYNLLQGLISRRNVLVLEILSVLFIIAVGVLPFRYYILIMYGWEAFSLLCLLYVLYRLFRMIKKTGAMLILFSYSVIFFVALHDVLDAHQILSDGIRLMHLGLLFFVFLQSTQISRNTSFTFNENNRLTENLIMTNLAYSRFVPGEFLQHLDLKSIIDIQMGDSVRKYFSILFLDIRGFTALAEKMKTADTVNFLNDFFGRMLPNIQDNGGFIDKYIGDAILALFPGAVDYTLKGAVDMYLELNRLNEERSISGAPPIRMGIGIDYGEVILATIGHSDRMETTVIGDTVNLASRVENLTKTYGVSLIVTNHFYRQLKRKESLNIREIDQVRVRGKEQTVLLYEVFDVDPPETIENKKRIDTQFRQGLQAYRDGRFEEALKLFRLCSHICPTDTVTALYIQRCERYIANPPGDEWHGVSRV